MIRNDLILKYVEQLSKVIAKILGLVGENKHEEAIKLINETLKAFDLNNIDSISIEYYESLADILKIKGELEKDNLLLEKALTLYQKVDNQTKTFSFERAQKIESTQNSISQNSNYTSS